MDYSDMEVVYQKYSRLVYGFLYSHTHDAEWSEEMTQETFVILQENKIEFREIGEILGKSENWSRTVFFRAKQKIRKEISQNE